MQGCGQHDLRWCTRQMAQEDVLDSTADTSITLSYLGTCTSASSRAAMEPCRRVAQDSWEASGPPPQLPTPLLRGLTKP